MSGDKKDSSQHRTLTDHLVELRERIIRSLFSIIIAFGICWYFSDQLFYLIKVPISPYLGPMGLVFTGVVDKFMAHLKASILAAFILSAPYWLYQVWAFVSPGLYSREKKYAVGFIFSGVFLFLAGVLFAYYILYPSAFEYLLHFGTTEDKPMITIDAYVEFFVTTTFMFGLSFELPLVLVLLGLLGIIDAKFLKKNRRYAAVLLAVAAAALTPQPDALSMLFMFVPLLLLYESAIWALQILVKNKTES